MLRVAAASHVGALGFDSVQAIASVAQGQRMYASGMRFAMRYLGTTTPTEVDMLHSAGLAVMPVTYSRKPGWVPSASLGHADAIVALAHLKALGIPRGVTVFLDLEGPGGHAQDVVDWVNAWAADMKTAGYDPGLYVGYGTLLTSHELMALGVDRYWHSISRVTDSSGALAEPGCGWCVYQLQPSRMWEGVWIDVDVIQADYQGRLPTWCVKS